MSYPCIITFPKPGENHLLPRGIQFITKATQWGCTHEAVAKEHYVKVRQESHADMSVVEGGLVINPEWPHLGASPDGIVQCTCCGKGVLEIKCPYCKHDQHIEVTAASCLTKAADGSLQQDRSHAYYYQVQTQIFICKVEYCDFCVCKFPETGPSLYTKRIYPDSDFWHTCIDRATHFFRICIFHTWLKLQRCLDFGKVLVIKHPSFLKSTIMT